MKRPTQVWLWAGIGVLAALGVVALAAPWVATHDPAAINLQVALQPPSAAHWCGTDALGRDIFSRLVYGARVSLLIGIGAVGIAIAVGVLVGLVAGWFGGWVDQLLMRFVDIMLCFPSFFLLLAIVAMLGQSLTNIILIIGLTSWEGTARLVRAEVLTLKERDFVRAAQVTGAGHWRIMARHLLPNALSPVLVSATLGIGGAILVESGLSFLGLGIQPPMASWGNLLMDAKATLGVAWWQTAYPGFAILVTVLACHLVGEGLRERLGRSS